ncbi:MAG TPA: PEP-CTERM sorting domain-containing protein [Burkholderiaceae bacterium]
MTPIKTLAIAGIALSAFVGSAQAADCTTFGSGVDAGTSSTADVTYNGVESTACVISAVNPQQGAEGNTSGFSGAFGSDWDLLAKVSSTGVVNGGNPIVYNGITFTSSITGLPGTSGSWTLTSDQGVTLDLVFAMHGSNRSGAFLFDDLSLASGGTGAWEINWLNLGGNIPNYSSLTLFVRDVAVAPVPEPETYALMLAGLGAIGFIARRRKA